MTKVKVPKEVAAAFNFYEQKLFSMPKETKHFVLMAIPFSIVHGGPAEVLKKYASSNPTKYLHSLLDGYEARIDFNEELVNMIEKWLNEPYHGSNEREDVKVLVNKITKHFQQQT